MFTIELTEQQKNELKQHIVQAEAIEKQMVAWTNSGDMQADNELEVELNLLIEELDTFLLDCVEHVMKQYEQIIEDSPLYNDDGSMNVGFSYIHSTRAAARMFQFCVRLTTPYGYFSNAPMAVTTALKNIPVKW